MYIKKTVKLPDGSYTFEGEISDEEHEIILTAGLNLLLQQGAMPMFSIKEEDIANLQIVGGEQ